MRSRSDGVDALVAQTKVSRRFQLAAIRLLGLQSHYARRVLCDAEGQLTPEAERLLALLAQSSRLNRHGFEGDADRRLFDLGAQHMVRLLLDWSRADSGRIARVQQQLQDEMKG